LKNIRTTRYIFDKANFKEKKGDYPCHVYIVEQMIHKWDSAVRTALLLIMLLMTLKSVGFVGRMRHRSDLAVIRAL
jgi:hypothetical protein